MKDDKPENHDIVVQVLKTSPEPIGPKEVVARASQEGYELNYDSIKNKLPQWARQKDSPIEKPSRGLYTLPSNSHTGNNSAQSTPTGEGELQTVPELEAGAGDEMIVVSNDLQLPKQWIRQTYGIRPERLCVMRVRGDSMVDTLRPGQRLVAAQQNGEDLEDGVIYGLRNDHGFSVKRLRFDRKEGERVIWIWSDNPDYEEQRRWLTLPEFDQEYTVVAKALEVGQKL